MEWMTWWALVFSVGSLYISIGLIVLVFLSRLFSSNNKLSRLAYAKLIMFPVVPFTIFISLLFTVGL